MLCTTWGVNYFIDVVCCIGLPLEKNRVFVRARVCVCVCACACT